MTTRLQYSREFKVEAVRMIMQQNLCVAEVTQDLNVSGTVLHKWKKELASER